MSRIYTSYYGNRHLPENAFRVQVSASKPRTYGVSAVLTSALPDKATMTVPLRDGSISEDDYKNRYGMAVERNFYDIVRQLGDIEEKAGDRPVVLLSYAGKDRPDSREILAGQLRSRGGMTITEL